jgi:hypothetical protein
MQHVSAFDPAFVIRLGSVAVRVSVAENASLENGQSSGFLAGQKSGAARMVDPFQVRADFPEMWARYIRANFRSVAAVVAAFEVSERTARKWWEGETGAHGGHVAVACRMHPVAAPAMLFDAE